VSLGQPRALVFDWDNTLVDTWRVIHHALTKTFIAMEETPWTIEEVRQRVRRSARESFPLLFGPRADQATRIFYAAFEADHLELLRPLAGAEDLLRDLAHCEGLYRAVLSNKLGHLLRREVTHLGWTPLFTKLVGANDAKLDKPARDALEMALEAEDLRPGPDVWVIGDTDVDIACGVQHGCKAVLVRPEPPVTGEFPEARPHAHVRNCAELKVLLADSGLKFRAG